MQTLQTLIDTYGVDVHDHLDRDELVPVLDGIQFQGDVAVVPAKAGPLPGLTPHVVPATGIAVVRGESGGNTHLLLADGLVTWLPVERPDNGLDLGHLVVAAGATAFLAHPEHAYSGIRAGRYVVRQQREQADEVRLVAD